MLLAFLIPILTACVIPLLQRWPNVRDGFAILAGIALFLSIFLQMAWFETLPPVTLFTIMPGLDIAFHVEPVGLLFALTAAFLWPVTTLFSIGYMRGNGEAHQTRFTLFFALSLTATMGIAFAANLFTLFTFYEVLTLVTYPLVTHHGNKARYAGRVYLGILMTTSIGFFLTAMIWTWHLAGHLDFTPGGILPELSPTLTGILLFLYVFGIGKAALMPFHRWLPAAMVAPTPVSALLHAVAVVKAGVFSIIKIIVYIVGVEPLGDAIAINWWSGGWLVYIAGISLLLSYVVALRQDNLKRLLAYSTIGQLAYIVMATAVLLPLSLKAAILHISAHAFGKITLFFAAGAIYTAGHKKHISELDGIGKAMPWTMTAFAVGALSVIGIPPTLGFYSKWLMLGGMMTAQQYFVVTVVALSTLLSAAYFLPIILRAFFRPLNGAHGEAPWPSVVALCITATGSVALFFFAEKILALLDTLV